ncbi:hypothetical protein ACFL4L_00520 [bacterium]
MKKTKRIIVATISGLIFGFVCLAFASSGSGEVPLPISLQIIVSRTLIGFAIGISCLSFKHWSIHGIVMGILFSLPLAFSSLMMPESPELSTTSIFISTMVMGMIYGLLIEVITSVLFRAKT